MISTNVFFKLYQSDALVCIDDTLTQFSFLPNILKEHGIKVDSMHTPLNTSDDQYKMMHMSYCNSICFKDAYLMVAWLKQFGLNTVSPSRGTPQGLFYNAFVLKTNHVSDIKYFLAVDEFLKLDPYNSTMEDVHKLKGLYRNQLVN